MDIGCWCKCNSSNPVIYEYDHIVSRKNEEKTSKAPIWRRLWRKIKREKKRIHNYSTCSMRYNYDPHTYAQNFDEGTMWDDDAGDISRSFSARFAVPSRIFEKNDLMVL
ncbi:hypothetical protein LIER_21362 [Lithospermum erythrorhizon]|uniref:Uncharacterized protein n=1 Tax=Lithospermum erythrorhizon TaxID=34254 RepID=A0AAV3QQ29_LITER